jgi:chromosome segregation ATPase
MSESLNRIITAAKAMDEAIKAHQETNNNLASELTAAKMSLSDLSTENLRLTTANTKLSEELNALVASMSEATLVDEEVDEEELKTIEDYKKKIEKLKNRIKRLRNAPTIKIINK